MTISRPLPRLVLTAEGPDFNAITLSNWKDEGYQVTYLPFVNNKKEYIHHLNQIADSLESGETYAIVAYGDAAAIVLELCLASMPKLGTLVAYYPAQFPPVAAGFPRNLNVLLHLAGSQLKAPKYRSYTYPDAEIGFAEVGLKTFDKISTSLAWTRTLGAVRKGFGIEVDLEKVWEDHIDLEFFTKDVDATMKTMVPEPYVNHIPTLTGGIGYKQLYRFYRDFFIPCNPPSMKMRLLSRTIGTDRVVDEMHVSFKHTQKIPWMIPGVEPTGKDIEFILVSVICIRGGKLYHEHIHWDQATVLVQLGLLDPNLVPGAKTSGKRLPVVGAAGAWKVLDENSVESNELIPGW